MTFGDNFRALAPVVKGVVVDVVEELLCCVGDSGICKVEDSSIWGMNILSPPALVGDVGDWVICVFGSAFGSDVTILCDWRGESCSRVAYGGIST